MSTKWTEQQQQAIMANNRRLLISAAAGSGKTAVLIERVLRLLKDGGRIDRIMICTFTKAAAEEIKERLNDRISDEIERQRILGMQSGKEGRKARNTAKWLREQLTRIPASYISTIHGICFRLIKAYHTYTNVDPSVTVADDVQAQIMKTQVLSEVIEKEFRKENPLFMDLVKAVCHGRTTGDIDDLILKIYEYSNNTQDPDRWLDTCLNNYAMAKEETVWFEALCRDVKMAAEDMADIAHKWEKKLLGIEAQEKGKKGFAAVAKADGELFESLSVAAETHDFIRMRDIVQTQMVRQATKRNMDTELKEAAEGFKESRNLYKDTFSGLKQLLMLTEGESNLARQLVEVVRTFADQYRKEKELARVLDFSDLEHVFLNTLVKEGCTTEEADIIASEFDEIIIDEVQDNSCVQDAIFHALGRTRSDSSFTRIVYIGDVKQSIYGFRQAAPELFVEKYNKYERNEDAENRLIELNRNFRSRQSILDFCNYLFEHCMEEKLNGIRYSQHRLIPGATYPLAEESVDVVLTHADDYMGTEEAEAEAAANKIAEMLGRVEGVPCAMVTDKQNGSLRPAEPGDIAVLTRTAGKWSDAMIRALNKRGIRSISAKTGLFNTVEVGYITSLLLCIDNPTIDIPFVAALHGPAGQFTNNEIASIAAFIKGNEAYERPKSYYGAAMLYAEKGPETELRDKLNSFLDTIESYAEKATYTPVPELIDDITESFSLAYIVGAMPDGERRLANINRFRDKAAMFVTLPLHAFCRYIERISELGLDDAESSVNESTESVRIVTWHKSKGLEYPICVVIGLGKEFNLKDTVGMIVMDQRTGIGLDLIDADRHYRRKTLQKAVIANCCRLQAAAEEIRLLYVAFTRAKEHLVLIDCISKNNRLEKVAGIARYPGYSLLRDMQKYNKVLLPILSGCKQINAFFTANGQLTSGMVEESSLRVRCMEYISGESIASDSVQDNEETDNGFAADIVADTFHYDANNVEAILNSLPHEYRYADAVSLPCKYAPDVEADFKDVEITKQDCQDIYTETGNCYHRFMELCDLTDIDTPEKVNKQLAGLVEANLFSVAQAERIIPEQICAFTKTEFYSEITSGATIFRERCYLMNERPASGSYGDKDGSINQGIIDLQIRKSDGSNIVVDYKSGWTDDDGERLKRLYSSKIQQYVKAVEGSMGDVTNAYIFSFRTGKAYEIDLQ